MEIQNVAANLRPAGYRCMWSENGAEECGRLYDTTAQIKQHIQLEHFQGVVKDDEEEFYYTDEEVPLSSRFMPAFLSCF